MIPPAPRQSFAWAQSPFAKGLQGIAHGASEGEGKPLSKKDKYG